MCNAKQSIYLSYARRDDEPFVMRLYQDLTKRGFDVWWDRVSMPSRNLTFHQEIRDAVAECGRLVLVVGPQAIESDYVRQEWQFAWYQADKVVTPILRLGDYPLPIEELALLHCEDFRDDDEYYIHLENLARQLLETPAPLGKLISVPELPVHFLARSERLQVVRDVLRADPEGPVVIGGAAALVGVHGMGGIGKSVLASAVAHDRLIRYAFPDGVIWIALGPSPNVANLQRRVHRDLGGDGAFETAHEGKGKLKELLAKKAVLLVIDDVWRRADFEGFDVGGARCRALITTRDASLLASLGGTHHVVELLSDEESLRLLSAVTGLPREELPQASAELVSECGRLPLAVALCGALVSRGMGWQSVLDQLRQARLDRIADLHPIEPHHRSVWHAIHVGVEALPADKKDSFLELAVFPPDETTPEAAAGTLWAHTAQHDDWTSKELLTNLEERSLIQTTKADDASGARRFWLHDLVFDYARRMVGELKPLNAQLLSAYESRCPDGWPSGPNDGYFFQHLRHHLVKAGNGEELIDLLHDLRWLEAKNDRSMVFDLVLDYSAAIEVLALDHPKRRILNLIDEALRRDIYFIARHARDYPQALFQCLWNICWWYDCPEAPMHYEPPEGGWPMSVPWNRQGAKLFHLLEDWRDAKSEESPGFFWVRSERPPMLPLGTGTLSVLRHPMQESVISAAFTPDGRLIVTAAWGRFLRVWNAATGEQLRSIQVVAANGPPESINDFALSPDGNRILTASNAVRVWDTHSGREIACLHEGPYVVPAVSYSPDGRFLISSLQTTINIWDADSGSKVNSIDGLESAVQCLAAFPDGRRLAGGLDDGTVRIWDLDSGVELACLSGHESRLLDVDVSNCGRMIGSASNDKTVRVWDSQAGSELYCLHGHDNMVMGVAFSPDGKMVASAGWDKTVRVWGLITGTQIMCFRGHISDVRSVAFSSDGMHIISASTDDTARVWDLSSDGMFYSLSGHQGDISGHISCLAASPDGSRIATGSFDQSVRVWDASKASEQLRLEGHMAHPNAVVFSKDATKLFSVDDAGKLIVWDADTGSVLLQLGGKCGGREADFSISPDGSWIAGCSWDPPTSRFPDAPPVYVVRVWSALNGREHRCFYGHTDHIYRVAWSPDSQRLASASRDGVRVWDIKSDSQQHYFRNDSYTSAVAYSPDGQSIVTGSWDRTVRVWDAFEGTELLRLEGHDHYVDAVAYSPDGSRIASCQWNEVRVWDAGTGHCLDTIKGKVDFVGLARGEQKVRCRTVFNDPQTIVEDARTGTAIGWFPVSLHHVRSLGTSQRWAAANSNHLYLICLEGESVDSSDQARLSCVVRRAKGRPDPAGGERNRSVRTEFGNS